MFFSSTNLTSVRLYFLPNCSSVFSTLNSKLLHFNVIFGTVVSSTTYVPYGRSSIIQYPFASVGALHLYVFTLFVPIDDFNVAVNSAPSSGDFAELVVSPIYLCISIELYIGVSGASTVLNVASELSCPV